MRNFLVVNEMCNDYFFPYLELNSVEVLPFYKKTKYEHSIVHRTLRKIGANVLFTTNLDRASKTYDGILLFDCSCGVSKLKQIAKIKGIPKILFIWNPMEYYLSRLNTNSRSIGIDNLKRIFDRVYYFDKSECMKYGVDYYPTVYSRKVAEKYLETNNRSILFLGAEKNRGVSISQYASVFRDKGLRSDIYLFSNRECEINSVHYFTERKKYSWYLEKVSHCGAILDISQDGQTGFTQRVMESIFFEKKLITSNRTIVDYDIYNKNNVFILGVDDINNLNAFMDTPYSKLEDSIIDKYDFQYWIENAFSGLIL